MTSGGTAVLDVVRASGLSSIPVPREAIGSSVPGVSAGPVPWRRTAWTRRYVAVLVGADALLAALVATAVIGLAAGSVRADAVDAWATAAVVLLWPALLAVSGAYDERIIGSGSDEFRRVGRAGLLLLAAVGFLSYAAALELDRSLVVFAVPGMVAATLLGRLAARRSLRGLRRRGLCTKRVVVVGRGGAVLGLVDRIGRERFAGLEVVAACVTSADRDRVAGSTDLPVGGLDDVLDVARRTAADTIAVTSASETAAQYLRELSWQLEGTGLELLVAPGLIEVAGPRLHIRPFEGLPLLSVEEPQFEGWRRVVKSLVDRTTALIGLVLLSPVLLGIAIAVKLSSPGPVIYRQERIGLGGRRFTMLKFRSMVVDAEARLAELTLVNESDGLLFKMRADPRVTPVGRWLRRLSLDELPQLFNVLGGSMSLVGPRPPLPSEVARYDRSVSRRLLVKPGLTGLWQISGRSDLPWEEAVRLDLRYVENWSLAMDLLILWKTGRAVLGSSGAY
jgi:exopolysaccharide biosynthesis polyprenyl glycosylphosphotransferase